jgi:PAS domain S-box-containing protein
MEVLGLIRFLLIFASTSPMELTYKPISPALAGFLQALPGSYLLLLPDAPRFTIAGVTDGYLKLTDRSAESILHTGLFEAFGSAPSDNEKTSENLVRASLEEVLRHKLPHQLPLIRYDVANADGVYQERYWSTVNKPILNEEGEIMVIIHSTEDVTASVTSARREQQIRDIEKSFHLFMQAPVIIGVVKEDEYVIELANEQLLEVWGRQPSVIGQPLFTAIPELQEQGFKQLLDEVRETGIPFHAYELPITLVRKGEAEVLFFDFVYKPFYEGDSKTAAGVFAVGHDVTRQVAARREMEVARAAAEKQKRLYEAITASTPDLIYVFDLQYRFIYANEALLTMWGRSREEAIGKGLLENGYEPWHAEMHEREIDQVVATGKPVRGEVSFPHATLGTRVYDYIFVPVFGSRGEVEAIAGTTRDITELKKAQDVLKQSGEKMEALVEERTRELQRSNKELEQFAYAASHDMKEPVRKIHFFADRLRSQLLPLLSKEQEAYFEKLENASKRMGTLIDDLLTYSQATNGTPETELIDLNRKVRLVLDDLEIEVAQRGASIQVDPLPAIRGNRRQIQQLFQNLISNAMKYSKPGRAPQVRITSRAIGANDPARQRLPAGDSRPMHLIQVIDRGIGFPQAEAEKIFDMFTRLHGNAEYRGTGVGLSIAKKVAENHGGRIWAESQPGEGSVFSVLLPAEPSE